MSSNRAQISLVFKDDVLYNNFIVPCKKARTLHSIIIKCLASYYYDTEIRAKIENIEITNTEEDAVHITSQQESINNIRDLLTLQGFFTKEMENAMEDGIDDFSDILDKVNQRAVDSGVVSSYHTQYGSKALKFITKKDDENAEEGTAQYEEVEVPKDFGNTISEMKDLIALMKDSGMISQMQEKVSGKSVVEEEKVSEKNVVAEDEISDKVEEDIVEEKVERKKPTVKRGKKITSADFETVTPSPNMEEAVVAPPPKEEPVLGEASGALTELLGSLEL